MPMRKDCRYPVHTVWHDDGMVLSSKICLNTLAGLTTSELYSELLTNYGSNTGVPLVNMLPGSVATNKTNSFDLWVITDSVHRRDGTMDYIQDACG